MTDRIAHMRNMLHRVASCLHSMIAEREITVVELAVRAGVPERILRRMLAADERVAGRAALSHMAAIAAALDFSWSVRITAREDRPGDDSADTPSPA